MNAHGMFKIFDSPSSSTLKDIMNRLQHEIGYEYNLEEVS